MILNHRLAGCILAQECQSRRAPDSKWQGANRVERLFCKTAHQVPGGLHLVEPRPSTRYCLGVSVFRALAQGYLAIFALTCSISSGVFHRRGRKGKGAGENDNLEHERDKTVQH
jgi:hypothetical protein